MRKIDPTNRGLQNTSLLVHGDYNTGKSNLLGSALSFERENGKCIYIHVEGEPSTTSLYIHNLEGVELVTMESIDDVQLIIKEYGPFRMTGLDSLIALETLAENKITGGNRAPGDLKKGEGVSGMAEWGRIKFEFKRAVLQLLRASQFLIAVCPSSKNVNDITGEKYVTPDLLGKNAVGVVGWFHFAGYMEVAKLTPEKSIRKLDFSSRTDALTRCNAPKPITKPIIIPNITKENDKTVCWTVVRDALNEALKG